MRLNRIQMKDFRSHRDTLLQLGRVNIVRGANGSGKSSLQMAIEMALTGRCAVTDAGGRGAEALISTGAKNFNVMLETDTGYRVEASRGNLLVSYHDEHQQRQFAGKAALANIETNFAPVAVLSAVLNAGRFLEMNEKEQKALLAGALASEAVTVDAEIRELMFQAQNNIGSVAQVVTTAGDVDMLHKRYFEQRTQVNRDLKNLGEITAPDVPADMPNREKVFEQISALMRQRDVIVGRIADRDAKYKAALAKVSGTREKRSNAEKEKARLEGLMLSGGELAKLDKIAKGRAKADKLDADIAQLQKDRRDCEQLLAELRRPQNGTCSKCGQKVPTEDRSVRISTIEAELQAASEDLAKKQADRLKLGDPAEADRQIKQHQQNAVLYAQYEQLLAAGDKPTEQPVEPDNSQDQAEISTIDDRIAKGRQIEARVIQFEGEQKQYEQVSKKRDALASQSQALDRLVEYFSDRGPLKAQLVGGRLPAFLERINQVLERFGFICAFTLEPFRLAVNLRDGSLEWLDLRQLSESEQYRFGIAFQIALAEATGVGFVIIDRADMLQPEARRFLTDALMSSSLDQALVLATGATIGTYPAIDGVAFIELTNIDGTTKTETFSTEETHVTA